MNLEHRGEFWKYHRDTNAQGHICLLMRTHDGGSVEDHSGARPRASSVWGLCGREGLGVGLLRHIFMPFPLVWNALLFSLCLVKSHLCHLSWEPLPITAESVAPSSALCSQALWVLKTLCSRQLSIFSFPGQSWSPFRQVLLLYNQV